MFKLLIVYLLLMQCSFFGCDFTFPDVKLEAFTPEGFKASIPEMEGVKLFAFHGNKNRNLSQVEQGEFNMDIVNPKVNGWFYFNPNLKLNIGDKVYYWVFIQHENLGYRKVNQVWEVTELLPSGELNKSVCVDSKTEILGRNEICSKQLIFDSTFFDNVIDEVKWKRAHFIAQYPDYEFCSYQKRNDICYIKDGKLIIKPKPSKSDEDIRGNLDLRNGCTSHSETECIMYQDGGFILPPVTSERIKTTRSFKYGTVEVKAKLPIGDWLYPEIYLQSSQNPSKKIWIAYARGNSHLIGNDGDDLGGSLLYGGPVFNDSEPQRSKHLKSTKTKKMFGDEFHRYAVIWEPKKISLLVDDVFYGEIADSTSTIFSEPMHVVLGVGVGGVNDFPDYYVSTNNKRKPWVNFERLQMKKFFNAREDWLPTWTNDKSTLTVEYVKIWAL